MSYIQKVLLKTEALFMVENTEFESVTSCMSSKRSNLLS